MKKQTLIKVIVEEIGEEEPVSHIVNLFEAVMRRYIRESAYMSLEYEDRLTLAIDTLVKLRTEISVLEQKQ